MSENTKDRYSGLFLLVLGVALWLYANTVQPGLSGPTSLGPAFFPKFLSVILMLLSAGLVVKSILRRGSQQKETAAALPEDENEAGAAPPEVEHAGAERPRSGIFVFVFTVLYVFIVGPLGFVPATVLCMAAVMWVLLVRKWYFYVGLIAFAFLTQYVFEAFLYIQLP